MLIRDQRLQLFMGQECICSKAFQADENPCCITVEVTELNCLAFEEIDRIL
jgi:hypothetical protein